MWICLLIIGVGLYFPNRTYCVIDALLCNSMFHYYRCSPEVHR